jgi:hypothetical protein
LTVTQIIAPHPHHIHKEIAKERLIRQQSNHVDFQPILERRKLVFPRALT